jgi:hypothetical protein
LVQVKQRKFSICAKNHAPVKIEGFEHWWGGSSLCHQQPRESAKSAA